MAALKLIAVGDSIGVVLPKELLTKLRVKKGDTLYAIGNADGVELTAYNPEFAKQIEMAEDIMRKDRDILKQLGS